MDKYLFSFFQLTGPHEKWVSIVMGGRKREIKRYEPIIIIIILEREEEDDGTEGERRWSHNSFTCITARHCVRS